MEKAIHMPGCHDGLPSIMKTSTPYPKYDRFSRGFAKEIRESEIDTLNVKI
jgi:hypothetical protein